MAETRTTGGGTAVGGDTAVGSDTLIITIDGPAGTGKSSVAHRLAARLGLDFLDTGAMYRAATLVAIEAGLDPTDGPAIAAALDTAGLRFDWSHDPPMVMLGDRDVSDRIRDHDVGELVSLVSAQLEVRTVLIARQRAIGHARPRLVTEGRDQGSAVFPDAPIRFYMHADVGVRAERRSRQLQAAGRTADTAVIKGELERRDAQDASRRDGPLVRPEGAIDVDTSAMTLDEVVDRMETDVREHLGDRLDP